MRLAPVSDGCGALLKAAPGSSAAHAGEISGAGRG
jgi:hypothetical protein